MVHWFQQRTWLWAGRTNLDSRQCYGVCLLHHEDTDAGNHSFSYAMGTVTSFAMSKAAEGWIWHSSLSSGKFKMRGTLLPISLHVLMACFWDTRVNLLSTTTTFKIYESNQISRCQRHFSFSSLEFKYESEHWLFCPRWFLAVIQGE